MSRWSALAWLLALAGALALRGPQLGIRPLHNDEGVNATKLAALWEKGEYRYDPHEYHGPVLHYLSLPFLWLSPAKSTAELSDATLRVVTVAFGVGLLFLLLLMVDGLGRTATAWAAIILAVSPAMVFYSRYFIHEMLLVFFTLLALAAGWRYSQSRKSGWAVLIGVAIGLMVATKETFVLSLAAMLFALLATRIWNQWRTRRVGPAAEAAPPRTPRVSWTPAARHVGLAMAGGGLVWLLFFSSFFTNASGLLDSLKTFLPWLNRAGGASPHLHPWPFYFERLLWFHPAKSPVWSEALIALLALFGAAAAFCSNCNLVCRPGLARFLVFYTSALTAIYTFLSYKTTWCLLNFWLGAILLAGIGAAALLKLCRTRVTKILLVALLGVGALHLALQSWLLSQSFATDLRNPYVYAQTSPHARELVARVHAIARVAPDGLDTIVKVISPESYWPLPWYLRQFNHIGWYDKLPADPYAPIVLTSAKLAAALDDKSDKKWIMAGYYELRPNVFLELYVERRLWEKFVATLPRDLD
jgi:uncharacterized protein (TIGR03663 family)